MKTATEEARQALYEGLVKPTVDQLLEALPAHARHLTLKDYEDLMVAGVIGLMAALRRHRPGQGVSERSFVQWGIEQCAMELLIGVTTAPQRAMWEENDGE